MHVTWSQEAAVPIDSSHGTAPNARAARLCTTRSSQSSEIRHPPDLPRASSARPGRWAGQVGQAGANCTGLGTHLRLLCTWRCTGGAHPAGLGTHSWRLCTWRCTLGGSGYPLLATVHLSSSNSRIGTLSTWPFVAWPYLLSADYTGLGTHFRLLCTRECTLGGSGYPLLATLHQKVRTRQFWIPRARHSAPARTRCPYIDTPAWKPRCEKHLCFRP